MKDETKISREEFEIWLDRPTTQFVFKYLKLYRDELNTALTDANLVFRDDGIKQLSRIIGQREGIDLLLNITYEEMDDERHRDAE